ncbi:MAG: MFS transporter [Desulfurococcales archaeon]|nr:MFS transporter [Desulfurococcales archaeon]
MGGGWDSNVKALAAYNAFRGFTVGGFMTLLPMYMKYLGYSMNSIGGIISAWSIVLSLTLPAIGHLIDTRGSRPVIIGTGLLLIASPLIAMTSGSLWGLGVAYGFFLFSFLAGQPARMNFLYTSVGALRMGEAVGLTSSLFSASRTVGPMAAGLMARYYGFKPSFLALALSGSIGLALFIYLSRPVPPAGSGSNVLDAYRYLIRPPRRLALVLGYVSMDRFAWSLWFPILSAHLYASGYTEDIVGYILTLSGVVRTVLMPYMGRLTDRIGASRALAVSELLGIGTALLYANPSTITAAATASTLMGVSLALWVPAYNALIARTVGGSGGAYSAANTARSLLGSPAPMAGGYLYDTVAPWAPFALSSALLVGAALYALLVLAGVESAILVETPEGPRERLVRPGIETRGR